MTARTLRQRNVIIAGAMVLLLAPALIWVFARRTFSLDRSICYSCFWKFQPRSFESALIEMYSSFSCADDLCRAETSYLVGNVIPDRNRIEQSLQLYKKAFEQETSPARKMLAAMALGMAGGQGDIEEEPYLKAAATLAYTAGRKATGDLLMKMREGDPPPSFGEVAIRRKLTVPRGATAIVLGTSTILVPPGALVTVQLERTFRDWLSYQFSFDFRDDSLVRDRVLNYHEGARLRDIMQIIPIRTIPAVGTLLAVRDGVWYAPDEKGVYRFRVLDDLVWYPTTKRRGSYALMTDTHGVSALVEQSIAARAHLVIGSGDSVGKTEAAFYLAQRGINVYMPCDRFIGDLLGYDGPGVILGTAPVRFANGRAVIGDQPVTIRFGEKVVATDSAPEAAGSPYDAPARYFRALAAEGIPLDLQVVNVKERQAPVVIAEAARAGANVIAIRIEHEDDYAALKGWLSASPDHRAVLFHSAPYPTGYRLFAEFPTQVTFGDPRPRFLGAT